MDAQILKYVRLALGVISDRLITILGLLSSGGLASWVMWGPEWERVATLAIYVIFVYCVVPTKERKNEIHSQSEVS